MPTPPDARTDRDHDDPLTVVRVLRRTASAFAATLIVVALALLLTGAWLDEMRVWNLGLALILVAALGCSLAGTAYVGQLILGRTNAIEAGEQFIADSMQQLGGDMDGPDELRHRRGGR